MFRKSKFFYIVTTFLLGLFISFNLIDIKRNLGKNNILYIARNINSTYESKMKYKLGSVFYDYIMFVKRNTEDDSTILIPPQGYPWAQSGNKEYLRYFLYPRTLVSGGEYEIGGNIDINSVDYILLDWGETNISEFGYTNGWPKFPVKYKSLRLWNPYTMEISEIKSNGEYLFSKESEKWGILKIK